MCDNTLIEKTKEVHL